MANKKSVPKKIGDLTSGLIILLTGVILGLLAAGGLGFYFFHVSDRPKLLVVFSAFLATFIASVMADEQNVRLRNGTFGAIAGAPVSLVSTRFEYRSIIDTRTWKRDR